MKILSKLSRSIILAAILSAGVTSCNYLDVIPPAQADYDDTMKDRNAVLDFLYTCYGGVPRSHPFSFKSFEQGSDEMAFPVTYGYNMQLVQWGTIMPTSNPQYGGDNIWSSSYNFLGYVNQFLEWIDVLEPREVTDEEKEEFKAEAHFLQAYYQFRILQAFGPAVLFDKRIDQNVTQDQYPGRSHFDYCVNYLVDKLDDAATHLPASRETQDLGRATSTICKALKARLLLYAASPLWNGSFYDFDWKNTNYETEGYGYELVSHTYDATKWDRALTACQEALSAAESAGYKLFDVETANQIAQNDKVPLPFIPGREEDTPENNAFKERVRMFQYLSNANEGDGNNELIWGVRLAEESVNGGEEVTIKLPSFMVKRSNGTLWGGNSTNAPTLYTVQHFYTENGLLPANDNKFYDESQWYTRFYEGQENTDNSSMPDNETVKYDIIKLNTHREARFYAWIVYDGCEFSPIVYDGKSPLWVNFKNTNTSGFNNARSRYYVGTGYLSKKFIDPNMKWYISGTRQWNPARRPFIRLAELYLNLAECYAVKGDTPNALANLNVIRKRAGLPDVTEADLTGNMDLMEWIRNERFVELFEEGHRYYDIRRWTIAPERMKETRYGLDGKRINPTFEEFNKPTQIDQPFKWDTKTYLLPVFSRSGLEELYSNPQMVQAPGY